MADNTVLNTGSGGDTIASDDIGGIKHQRVKIEHGADGSATDVSSASPLPVTLANSAAIPAGTNNIGDVDVLTVPTDPFGANADAASATGSISAKLRFIAATGIPVTALPASTNTIEVVGDVAHDAAAAGNPVLNAGYASAAAPTDVSADGDAVRLWALRSGALAVQPTFAGVLASTGNGASGTGVLRVAQVSDGTGVLATVTNVATIGTSVTPGTGATNLGKAEDAAHTSGDVGVLALGVRRDADTTPVSADGDYHAPIFDANGYLKVNIKAGAGSGGTALADNATFTRGTTSVTPIAGVVETSAPTLTSGNAGALSLTTGGAVRVAVASGSVAGVVEDAASTGAEEGVLMMGVRQDTLASSTSADGDYAYPKFSAAGAMYVTGGGGGTQYAEDAAAASGDTGTLALVVRQDTPAGSTSADGDYTTAKSDSVGRLWVNGSGVTQPVSIASGATSVAKAEDVASADADVGIPAMAIRKATPANTSSADGDYEMLQMSGGRMWASSNIDQINGVTPLMGNGASGTGALRVSIANDSTGILAAVTAITGGGVAHDGVGTGNNPLLVGGYASAAAPTDVSADGDAVRMWLLRSGAVSAQPTFAGVLAVAGNGASGTGVQRVTLANDSTGIIASIGTSVTPGTSAAHLGKAEDAAHTSGDTGVMALAVRQDTQATLASATGDYVPLTSDSIGSLYTRNSNEIADDAAFTPGTSRVQPVGFTADETATDSVDEGDIGAARMTRDRKLISAQYAHTAGGWTPVSTVSAASTNATSLKGSAGQVGHVTVTNINAAMRYLKFYNKATAPTVGTDTPVYVIPLPGGTTGTGATIPFGAGLEFTTGIAWALTTGPTVADTGAVAASEIVVSIAYK